LQSNFEVVRVDGLREVLFLDAGRAMSDEQAGQSLQQVLHGSLLGWFGGDGRIDDGSSSTAITVVGSALLRQPLATNRRLGS
jgi:hypothetical protein